MPQWWDAVNGEEQGRIKDLWLTGRITSGGIAELLAKAKIQVTSNAIHKSFQQRGWRWGSIPSDQAQVFPEQEPDPIIIAPGIHKYRAPRSKQADAETQVVLLSDGHAGKITPTFDPDVYKQRMEGAFQHMMAITTLHRNMYPINELVIMILGDNSQGENPYQGSRVESIAMGARNQVKQLAVPAHVSFVMSARENFEIVRVHGVPGNHGRVELLAPETSNWDLMLYDSIKNIVGHYDGIEIETSEDWYQIVEVQGYRFFLWHGDKVRCQQGVPLMALAKRTDAYFIQYGGFHYAVNGHWHKRAYDEAKAAYDVFMCGSLVSDDSWALGKGISSSPSQWTFGITQHNPEKNGLSWMYPLWVD